MKTISIRRKTDAEMAGQKQIRILRKEPEEQPAAAPQSTDRSAFLALASGQPMDELELTAKTRMAKAVDGVANRVKELEGGSSSILPELRNLQQKKNALQVDMDMEGAADVQNEMERLQKEAGWTLGDRLKFDLLGADKGYSLGKSLTGLTQKGLGQIAQFGGDALAMGEDLALAPFELLTGQKLGELSDTAPLNQWAQKIRENNVQAQEYFQENQEKGGQTARLLEDYGAATIAALPQAVVAMLTAGGSLAAQSTAGLSSLAAAELSPGVAGTVSRAVSSMAKDPQYWLAFSQVVGGGYEQAIQDQRDRGETDENTIRTKAALYAVGNGLLNAAVEIGGGIQTLPSQLQGGESVWRAWVDSMVDEGKEELVQGVIERALQNPIYGQNNPLFSTSDDSAIFNPRTAAEEFAGGAVVGGVLGGGQIAANAALNALYERQNRQEIPELRQLAEETVAKNATTTPASVPGGTDGAAALPAPMETAAPALPQALSDAEKSQMQTVENVEQGLELPEAQTPAVVPQNVAPAAAQAETAPGLAAQARESVENLDTTPRKGVTSYGETAGIEKTGDGWRQARRKFSSKTLRTVDAIGKITGSRIVFADKVLSEDGAEGNASYKDGVITLSLDAEDPILAATTHEVVHRIRDAAPEAYQAMARFVLDNMSEEAAGAALDFRQELYQSTDPASLTEETVADAFGRLMNDATLMEQFVRDDRSAAQKVADFFRDLLREVRMFLRGEKGATLSTEQRAEFRELEGRLSEMERMFSDALQKTEETVQGQKETAGEVAEEQTGSEEWKKNTATEGGETLPLEIDEFGAPEPAIQADGFTGGSGIKYTPEQAQALSLLSSDSLINAADASGVFPVTQQILGLAGSEEGNRIWNALVESGLIIEDEDTNVSVLSDAAIFDERARRLAERRAGRNTDVSAEQSSGVRVTSSNVSAQNGQTGLGKTLASNIDKIRDMQPVASLSGEEMNDRTKKPSEQIREFFAAVGSVFRRDFGQISFGEYGVGGMLNHRPLNRAKMVSLTAVPEVIQTGRIISDVENWKGRGYRSVVFAAPVKIADTTTYVAAVVNKNPDGKFYLSECVDVDGNYVRIENSSPNGTKSGVTVHDGVTATPGELPSGPSILPTGEESKPNFSMKSKDYLAEIAHKDEMIQHLRDQMKRTKGVKTDAGTVTRQAKAIAKEYATEYDAGELGSRLQELYDYIAAEDTPSWEGAYQRAESIARDILENSRELNDELYKQYSDLRKYLRTTKIHIPQTMMGDLESAGGYNELRKANMGRVTLSSAAGVGVDQVYQNLANNYPEFFDEQRTMHPADQLMEILDVLDWLRPTMENPYSADMASAVEYLAYDLIERFYDIPQQKPTFADRQARKLTEQRIRDDQKLERLREEKNARIEEIRQEGIRKARKAADDVRKQRDETIRHMKERQAQIRKDRAARRADSKARTRLLHIVRRLQNKKLPAVSRALLNQYMGDLDTVAKSMTGKTLDKLNSLRDWYNEQKQNDPDFIADPATEKKLERLSKRQIDDLTAQEVSELTEVLLNIENQLTTERKLLDSQDRRDVYLMGEEIIRDLNLAKGSRPDGILGAADKYLVTETLSPVREIRRLTGYMDADPLAQAASRLSDGQRAMLDYQMRAEKPFQTFARDKAFSESFSGKKAKEIKITGTTKDGPVEVTISPAMRAALYLHSLNDQNLRHIKEGGITVPDWTLYRQGKISEAYARGTTIKLSPSQVRGIAAGMTEQEKRFARAAFRYYNEVANAETNAVSERLVGYSIAQVDKYYPIHTDPGFTRTEFEALKFDGTIEGMGSHKERVNAANPILLRDVNADLEQSIRMDAKYVGLAIPVRNFNKLLGVTTGSFNADGTRNGYESSVQQALKKAWGEAGLDYVEKLMSDLQNGPTAQKKWAKALSGVRGKYAGAVLTLNLSVAAKQAASYPSAAAVLGWKPLARAMSDVGKVDLEKIARYTPLQWYRSKGFSTKELGDMKAADRQLPAVLNWVQGMDVLTTRKLWKASEYYVRENNRDLKPGTDPYYRQVAEVYNRVIEETQPNYTVMQRPQLLRSDDSLMANLAMFKTQPFQNFNILYDAGANYAAKLRQEKMGAATKDQVTRARKDLGKAVTSQLAQLAVFAGMTAGWALLRGKKDKFTDEDGEFSLEKLLASLGKDMAGGAASMVPFGSDVWELVSSRAFGDTYYGMDVVTVSSILDTVSGIFGMADLILDTAKQIAAGEAVEWDRAWLKLDKQLDRISKFAGVPYENVFNLFHACYRWACIAALGDYRGEYAAMRLTRDRENDSGDYYDLLYLAMKKDKDQYEQIYGDMLADGFDAEKIRKGMERRMKEDQGVKKVAELEQRYLSPENQSDYDALLAGLSQTELWGKASGEQRDKVDGMLYDLTAGTSTGDKLREKIDGGGLDDADYILFQLALDMADQPTESGKLGTYTNEELEAAIRMTPDLTREERAYLWSLYRTSDKNNPWK